jgi:hypothetical protein
MVKKNKSTSVLAEEYAEWYSQRWRKIMRRREKKFPGLIDFSKPQTPEQIEKDTHWRSTLMTPRIKEVAKEAWLAGHKQRAKGLA